MRDSQLVLTVQLDLKSTLWQLQVAEALREGRPVEPEAYDCVTIFFSDVPDFQNICTKLDPLEVSSACFWVLASLCLLFESCRL